MKKLLALFILFSFSLISYSQSGISLESKEELRKRSPNRIVLRIGAGLFANYTYDIENGNQIKKFDIDNFTYSAMVGYRSGFNSNNYKFSSTGRDMNRGNVVALFYQSGTLNNVGLGVLDKADKKIFINNIEQSVRFTEMQVGVVWREFLRISGGKGSVKTLENLTGFIEDNDYDIVTAGINLRFGRLSPTLNYSLISTDGFETILSRWDIQININMYFWKKILHKDKGLL